VVSDGSPNTWDNGYPSGGNYWSDYQTNYPTAAEIDGSGIWNTPYVIDSNNRDNYPLMNPWTPPDIAVISVALSKRVVILGTSINLNFTLRNEGNLIETFNVTLYRSQDGYSLPLYTFMGVTLSPGSTVTLTVTGLRFGVGLITLTARVYNAYFSSTYVCGTVWVLPIIIPRPWFLLYTGDGWCFSRFWHPAIPV